MNVRSDIRLGLLRYKSAPKCLLPGPFHHSGVGRNPEVAGPVRSYNLVFTYPCQPHAGDCACQPCQVKRACLKKVMTLMARSLPALFELVEAWTLGDHDN